MSVDEYEAKWRAEQAEKRKIETLQRQSSDDERIKTKKKSEGLSKSNTHQFCSKVTNSCQNGRQGDRIKVMQPPLKKIEEVLNESSSVE